MKPNNGMDVLKGLPDPVMVLDHRLQVIAASPPAVTLFGPRLEGRDLRLTLRAPEILEAVEAALTRGASTQREVTLSLPAERFFQMHAAPVDFGSSPRAAHNAILTLQDVTLVRLADRMRADFVANASHELRTPLASIVGFIETLQHGAIQDTEAATRFLSIMGEEAGRMQRIIEDLLSLARIEMHRTVQPEGRLDLATVTDDVLRSLAPQATARSVTLDLVRKADLGVVRADRDEIVQVLQNLIVNAIKYGRSNSKVTVTLDQMATIPGTRASGARVTITDQGEGIAPEHIPRLTERFYRVDTARSRNLGGTGLGLAIVKHIVNRHRGHLEIVSKLGEGTSVSVALPFASS